MKILIFDGTFQTTAFIRRLMAGLVKAGHQIYVLGFNLHASRKVAGVKYCSLGSNQDRKELLKTSLLLQGINFFTEIFKQDKKQLQQKNLDILLHKIQPDVIHAQWISVLPWLEPYLKNKRYPVILSQRGYHTNVRPFVNKENYEYLHNIYPQLSGLHSVSNAISNQGKKIGVPRTGIDQVVYTGLDLDHFEFQPVVKQDCTLNIISVGRPHWKKGYSYAIQAMRVLKEKKINFKYTIVGGQGDEELSYLIKNFQLQEHVNLFPKLNQAEVFKKMEEASVFLLPSIEEGIANVAVEAMVIGTPVISTTCGGMEELIIHEEEGFLVASRAPQEMVLAIVKLFQLSEEQIKTIILKARHKIEAKYTEQKMVKGMLELYQKVI